MENLSSLNKLDATATSEFAKLIDDSGLSYRAFAERHRDTAAELLARHGYSERDVWRMEPSYSRACNVYGGAHHVVVWFFDGRLQQATNDEKKNVLYVARLLDEIHTLDFLDMDVARYRAARDELRKSWWYGLVVPELRRLGVTLHFSMMQHQRRGRGINRPAGSMIDPDARRAYIKELKDKNTPRPEALKKLAQACGVTTAQASRLMRDCRWPGQRGRPK